MVSINSVMSIRVFDLSYFIKLIIQITVLVLTIHFSLGPTTLQAINPARDFGPRIVHALLPIPNKGDSDWGYAWIPVLGPIVGGTAGACIYQMLLNHFL
ncbi:putative glycerol uptake facilitator protein [Streptococcus pasteurianus]|nr:putative glycerol uptake facilitator protein [Streptococcus pasteurianus]